jgi:diguanylate cyclase (GGDEF)-like protein
VIPERRQSSFRSPAPKVASMSGRRRLLGGLALVLLLGSFVTSVGSYLVSQHSVRSNIVDHQLPLTGDSVYSEIQRDLLRPVSISDQMAHDTFLKDWYAAGETDSTAMVRYLGEIQRQFGATTSFFISERTRAYYHPTGIVQRVNKTDPDDSWYFRVRSMVAPYEINVDTDRANHETTTAFINYRVLDAQGHFIGVTGVGITLQTINARIRSYESRFGLSISFVDHQGNIVLSGSALKRETRSLVDRPGIGRIAPQILAGAETPLRLTYTDAGATVLVNTRFVPELKWFLIVERNEAPDMRPIRNVLYRNLIVGLIITLLVIGVVILMTSRYQRDLEQAASTDPLTQAFNRRRGEELFIRSMRDADRSQRPLSLLLLDIDHFKDVNDVHGHPVGDRVLKEVTRSIRSSVRRTDHVIRWGGEEFLVLLPDCPTRIAEQLAGSLLALISTQHLHRDPSLPEVTASIGVTEWFSGETCDEALSRVDRALYLAKDSGRNQVRSVGGSTSVAQIVASLGASAPREQ